MGRKHKIVMARTSNLPTTKVDPIVAFLGKLITQLVHIDEDQDNKVEGAEILKFAQNVGFDAFATFKDFSAQEFLAQLKDLDEEERKKEIEIFAQDFVLRNQEAEWLLEDWLRFLEQGIILVQRSKTVFSKPKAA